MAGSATYQTKRGGKTLGRFCSLQTQRTHRESGVAHAAQVLLQWDLRSVLLGHGLAIDLDVPLPRQEPRDDVADGEIVAL